MIVNLNKTSEDKNLIIKDTICGAEETKIFTEYKREISFSITIFLRNFFYTILFYLVNNAIRNKILGRYRTNKYSLITL